MGTLKTIHNTQNYKHNKKNYKLNANKITNITCEPYKEPNVE
jgi:hypothetical protein